MKPIALKKCTKCAEEKVMCEFLGRSNQCRSCRKTYYKEKRNKDPLVKWAQNNKSSEKLSQEKKR